MVEGKGRGTRASGDSVGWESSGPEARHGLPGDWIASSSLGRALPGRDPRDALGLIPACVRRMRERAMIFDLEELALASLAQVALHRDDYDSSTPLDDWLVQHVDRALVFLADREAEEERHGAPWPSEQARCARMSAVLGIAPRHARCACVVVNELDDVTRRVFFELVWTGKSAREVSRHGIGLERIDVLVRHAVMAIRAAIELPRTTTLIGNEWKRREVDSDG